MFSSVPNLFVLIILIINYKNGVYDRDKKVVENGHGYIIYYIGVFSLGAIGTISTFDLGVGADYIKGKQTIAI